MGDPQPKRIVRSPWQFWPVNPAHKDDSSSVHAVGPPGQCLEDPMGFWEILVRCENAVQPATGAY